MVAKEEPLVSATRRALTQIKLSSSSNRQRETMNRNLWWKTRFRKRSNLNWTSSSLPNWWRPSSTAGPSPKRPTCMTIRVMELQAFSSTRLLQTRVRVMTKTKATTRRSRSVRLSWLILGAKKMQRTTKHRQWTRRNLSKQKQLLCYKCRSSASHLLSEARTMTCRTSTLRRQLMSQWRKTRHPLLNSEPPMNWY